MKGILRFIQNELDSRELFCPLGLSYTMYYTMYMYTVFDLIGTRGAYVNLFSTTSAKRSPSGR